MKLNIIFRYDDFCLEYSEYQEELINIFEKEQIPLILGIIPFHEQTKQTSSEVYDYDLYKRVMNNQIKIGLHGYQHKNKNLEGKLSEFEGLDYDMQFRMLKEGSQFIQNKLGLYPTLFIPPFNTADMNTLKALYKLDYECISSSGLYNNPYINQLPATTTLEKINDIVSQVKNSDVDLYIVILFHKYECEDLTKLNVLFDFLKKNNCNFPALSKVFEELNNSIVNKYKDGCFYLKQMDCIYKTKRIIKRFKYLYLK